MDELILIPIIFISVFTLLGTIFFLIGYLRSRKTKYYERTEGIIVRKHKKSFLGFSYGDSAIPERNPTVTYEVEGKSYTYTSSMHQQPGIRIGKKVGVFYDPYYPEKALIDTFVQRGSLFTLLGGIFILLSIIIFGVLFTIQGLLGNSGVNTIFVDKIAIIITCL